MDIDDRDTRPLAAGSRRKLWISAVVAAAVLAVLWALAGSSGEDSVQSEASIFMLPEYVPEGFELTFGAMADAARQQTSDPDAAAGILLEYRPIGSLGPGDPHLLVFVRDELADPESSTCAAEAAEAEDRIHLESCMDEAEERLAALPGTRGFERIEIRGRPAHVVRASGTTLYDFSVTVYEGGPISSEVAGYLIDEAEVLEVAHSLRPVDPADFLDRIARD